MSTYNITSKLLIDNYAVLQTLENSEIAVGQSITVAGLGSPFNGTFTVLDLPEHEFIGIDSTTGFPMFNEFVQRQNQVLFACTGDVPEQVGGWGQRGSH